MSRTVNRVILIGNTGSEPDLRETANGTAVAHVSLATNRKWTTAAGEERERTDWHRLTFWRRSAETVAEYVGKGQRLYVEGHLEYGSFEREGVAIPTVDVVVDNFVMLDSKKEAVEEPEFATA